MQWYEWIPIILGSIGIVTALLAAIRFFIKYHVKESLEDIRHELKPNGGSSMKDQITRVEESQKQFVERQHEDDIKFENRLDKLESKIDNVLKIVIEKLSK
jgi:di/tripeptidase